MKKRDGKASAFGIIIMAIVGVVVSIAMLIISLIGGVGSGQAESLDTQLSSIAQIASEAAVQSTQIEEESIEGLTVIYISVGSGDCILVTWEGGSILIDSGDREYTDKVKSVLAAYGVTSLDYIIATQPDEAHIGGLASIISEYDCSQVFLPYVPEIYAESCASIYEALQAKGIDPHTPQGDEVVEAGEVTLTFVSPIKQYPDNDIKNNSLGFLLKYSTQVGSRSFLFLGDIQTNAQLDLISSGKDIHADVLLVPDHGSSYSLYESTALDVSLLSSVDPEVVVISGSAPSDETLSKLQSYGVSEIYRTDASGNIIAVTDGREMTWTVDDSVDIVIGETLDEVESSLVDVLHSLEDMRNADESTSSSTSQTSTASTTATTRAASTTASTQAPTVGTEPETRQPLDEVETSAGPGNNLP